MINICSVMSMGYCLGRYLGAQWIGSILLRLIIPSLERWSDSDANCIHSFIKLDWGFFSLVVRVIVSVGSKSLDVRISQICLRSGQRHLGIACPGCPDLSSELWTIKHFRLQAAVFLKIWEAESHKSWVKRYEWIDFLPAMHLNQWRESSYDHEYGVDSDSYFWFHSNVIISLLIIWCYVRGNKNSCHPF